MTPVEELLDEIGKLGLGDLARLRIGMRDRGWLSSMTIPAAPPDPKDPPEAEGGAGVREPRDQPRPPIAGADAIEPEREVEETRAAPVEIFY